MSPRTHKSLPGGWAVRAQHETIQGYQRAAVGELLRVGSKLRPRSLTDIGETFTAGFELRRQKGCDPAVRTML